MSKKQMTTKVAKRQSDFVVMVPSLAAGAMAVLVAFLAFAYFYDVSENNRRRQEIQHYVEAVGTATAWGVDNWLNQRIMLSEGIADSISKLPAADDANPHAKAIVGVLKSQVYEQNFIWTYYGEMDGAYHIWPHDVMPDGYDPRTRPWYHAALAAGEPTLTDPYFDISTGVETITVVAPVYFDTKLLGVVGADFSTETMSNILLETDLGGLGHTFLVSGDGKILAHPDRNMVSKSLGDAFPGERPELKNGVQFLENLATPRIVNFVKIPSLGAADWYLGVSIDKNAAFAQQNAFRSSAVMAAISAAIVLVLVLGIVIHKMLVRPLNEALNEADAASVAKSEFLASMSHEIRTPMNGVLGMAEVLMSTDLDERQRELGGIILSSGGALMTVINDVLDFAKLEAGKLRLNPAPFNLRHTVFEVATMMQGRAVEKDLEMIVRYDQDLPQGVVADESRLRQVLSNLIGNAVKFTEEGYVLVDVTGKRIGDEVELALSVKDTGIGIAEDELPRMFEQFEQADSSHTRQFGGTGLGLAISNNIVGLMGGKLSAQSEIGVGSKFVVKFKLPVDDSIQPKTDIDTAALSEVRVLAVDDNSVNRRIISELFEGWGLDATVVESPVKAMAALERSVAEEKPFHVMVLDYQMPKEDGASFAARVRSQNQFSNIPVVILSSIDDELSGRREGCAAIDAFLSKPVRPSQLMDILTRLLTDKAAADLRRVVAKKISAKHENKEPIVEKSRTKVLIVEDNKVNQMVLSQFINGEEYEIQIADNGAIGIDAYKKFAPDVVFMDVSMPVMDGLEATQCIRKYEDQNGLARTPIIATTAHVLEEDRHRCVGAGMCDFLAKPVKKALVEEMLGRWVHGTSNDNARQGVA